MIVRRGGGGGERGGGHYGRPRASSHAASPKNLPVKTLSGGQVSKGPCPIAPTGHTSPVQDQPGTLFYALEPGEEPVPGKIER